MAFVKWKTSSTYHIPTMYGRHLKFADGRESWDDGAGGPALMACGRKAPSDNDYVSQRLNIRKLDKAATEVRSELLPR